MTTKQRRDERLKGQKMGLHIFNKFSLAAAKVQKNGFLGSSKKVQTRSDSLIEKR